MLIVANFPARRILDLAGSDSDELPRFVETEIATGLRVECERQGSAESGERSNGEGPSALGSRDRPIDAA
jgi:hypothetical protein